MSQARARRLTAGVVTNRFEWPRPETLRRRGPSSVLSARTADRLIPPRLPERREMPLSPAVAECVAGLEKEAYDKRHADGERAGEASSALRVEQLLRHLSATIDQVASLRVGMMKKTERELVRLAVAMAERIVLREVHLDRELLLKMAQVAIERLGENVAATIHLHPADYEAVTARRDQALGHAIELVSDPAVERGGCLVRSAFGVIDAGIDTQIREVARALLGDEHDEEAGSNGGDPEA
jgi:flagellar biosynthesis/type III secretory pathway protein FliH